MSDDLDVLAGAWRFKKTGSKFVMYRNGMLSKIDISKDAWTLAQAKEIQRLKKIIKASQVWQIDRARHNLS